jgi:Acyltransferase
VDPNFYPPQLNPALVQLCQLASPVIGWWRYRMRLQVEPEGLQQLAALRNHRVLLLPNHPTFHDWIAIFLLSAKLREQFHYLAAYERFQGQEAWFLQQMGAYSIRRGLGDRASVTKTIELLMQPQCRLVLFPEGGCSFQNDTVMPFRTGAIQTAFQSINRLVKQGESVPEFYVVPISLKYRYLGDMTPVIDNMLTRLEKAVQVSSATTSYQRLRRVAEQVMIRLEKDYDLHHETVMERPWSDRIAHLKSHVLQQCEQKLEITSSADSFLRERVYKIQHILESRAEAIAADDFGTYEFIHAATARLLNFDAIYDGYVADHPTPERFLDTLIRLEREIFQIDQPVPKGDRKVLIHIGESINLKDYFKDYQSDRSSTTTYITEQLRQTVQCNLDRFSEPLELPGS